MNNGRGNAAYDLGQSEANKCNVSAERSERSVRSVLLLPPLPSAVQKRGIVTVEKKIVVPRAAYNSRLMISAEYTRRESPRDQRRKRTRRSLSFSLSLSLLFSSSVALVFIPSTLFSWFKNRVIY
jgi:hypothetical protein